MAILARLHGSYRLTTPSFFELVLRTLIIDAWGLPTVSPAALSWNHKATKIDSTNLALDPTWDDAWHDFWATDQAKDLFVLGFQFEETDNTTKRWYPQGLSGTQDAYDSGTIDNEKLLVVSWYDTVGDIPDGDGEDFTPGTDDRGSRITVIKVTNWSDDIEYRRVLLVRPVIRDSEYTYEIVDSHVGGIVWYGRWLYVAAGNKIMVFDMENI